MSLPRFLISCIGIFVVIALFLFIVCVSIQIIKGEQITWTIDLWAGTGIAVWVLITAALFTLSYRSTHPFDKMRIFPEVKKK